MRGIKCNDCGNKFRKEHMVLGFLINRCTDCFKAFIDTPAIPIKNKRWFSWLRKKE